MTARQKTYRTDDVTVVPRDVGDAGSSGGGEGRERKVQNALKKKK